jgi:hypothetical protein
MTIQDKKSQKRSPITQKTRQIASCVLGAVIACTFEPHAMAAQDERSLREECNAYSQTGVRQCLARKATESELILKQAEDKVQNALTKWKVDAQRINSAKTKFDVASKMFVKHRETQCAFNSSLGDIATANTLEIKRFACFFELNSIRSNQLNTVADGLPSK